MKKESKTGNRILIILCVLLAAVAILLGLNLYNEKKAPEVTNKTIETKLESVGELAGSKLTYRGLIVYKDGSIPYINEKGFSMTYTAIIKAGIDLKETEIKVTDDTITLTIPKAKILSVEVDPESLEFYDKKHSLFNWQKPEDSSKAVNAAKNDGRKNAVNEGLLKDAEKNTEELLKGLLKDLKTKNGNNYKIKIIVK